MLFGYTLIPLKFHSRPLPLSRKFARATFLVEMLTVFTTCLFLLGIFHTGGHEPGTFQVPNDFKTSLLIYFNGLPAFTCDLNTGIHPTLFAQRRRQCLLGYNKLNTTKLRLSRNYSNIDNSNSELLALCVVGIAILIAMLKYIVSQIIYL